MNQLIYFNLYEYDFTNCAYRVLQNTGWDMSSIPPLDKAERNRQIGLLQKNNPEFARYLHVTITRLIEILVAENDLLPEEIIIKQKDGITTTKRLSTTNVGLQIDLRGRISKLIFATDRKKWLIVYTNGNVVVKGITNRTINDSYYKFFSQLNLSNKEGICDQIEKYRKWFLSQTDITMFAHAEGEHCVIPLQTNVLKISKSALDHIELDDINKTKVWEEKIWPFIQPCMMYVTNRI